MTFSVTTTAKAENVTIFPATPMNLESVVARINVPYCLFDPNTVRIKQEGTTIRVDFSSLPCASFSLMPGGILPQDFRLGQFPPGVFDVVFSYLQPYGSADPTKVWQWGSAQFTVTDNSANKTGPFPLVDYTDHWWNPQESGMGFSIMQHSSDRIFAAWFVYDQASQPVWYTLQPGQWLSSTVYTGPIYKTTGTYLGATYDPGQLVVTPVGTGTFIFHDYSSATFNYTVDGITGTKEITRLSF